MIVSAIYGWIWGNPAKLFVLFDAEGNACGIDDFTGENDATITGYPDHPYIYWPVIDYTSAGFNFADLIDKTVCMSECPTASDDPNTFCKPNSVITDCSQYSTYTQAAYDTEAYFGKICMPTTASTAGEEFRS